MFYRILIYIVTAFLIGGAGYYFREAGIPDLIIKNFSQDKKGVGVSALEVFSGTYQCDSKSGCDNIIHLILQEDTTLDITATIDGEDISLGQGTWGIGRNGAMVLVIERKPDNATSSYPSSLIVNKISSLKLSNFSTKKGLLPGMDTNPTFTRIKGDVPTDAVPDPSSNTEQGTE
jgi:hypothetical protein